MTAEGRRAVCGALPQVTFPSGFCSERVFQRKLHLPVIGCRVGDRGRAREVYRNLSRASSRKAEVGMIKQIEEFGPELQLLFLEDLEILVQHKIEIHQVWPAQVAHLRIAARVSRLLAWRNAKLYSRQCVELDRQVPMGRRTEELEKEYRLRRETVAQIISEISEARTAATRATSFDAAALQQRLTILTGLPPETPLRQLAAGVTRTLTDQKSRIDRLERLNTDLSQSRSWLEDLRRFEEKRDAVKTSLDTVEAALKEAGNLRIAAGEALRQTQARNLRLSGLAQLREQGMRVGLQNGHCPLCGSSITSAEFDVHLKEIQELINAENRALAELTAQEASRTAE